MLPSTTGIVPISWLPSRFNSFRFIRLASSTGIVLLNWLTERSSICKLDRLPSEVGMGPLNWLLLRSKNCKVAMLPSSGGIVPESWFELSSSLCRLVSDEIWTGSDPESKLLARTNLVMCPPDTVTPNQFAAVVVCSQLVWLVQLALRLRNVGDWSAIEIQGGILSLWQVLRLQRCGNCPKEEEESSKNEKPTDIFHVEILFVVKGWYWKISIRHYSFVERIRSKKNTDFKNCGFFKIIPPNFSSSWYEQRKILFVALICKR